MKFVNVVPVLLLVVVNLASTFASPAARLVNEQISSSVAPILAQLYPGVVTAVATLSPDAATSVNAAVQQACDSVKDLNTDDAQITPAPPPSILSSITNALGSIISALLPTMSPFFTVLLSVARGDTAAAPTVVAVAQQTCNIVFNGAEA